MGGGTPNIIAINCNAPGGSRYYRQTVTFGPILPCAASFNLVADNAYRIYVNGTQVPGSLTTAGNCFSLTSLNGNTFTASTSGIFPYLLVSGENEIIIQVINCPSTSNPTNPSYIQGNFQFRCPDLTTGGSIGYQVTNLTPTTSNLTYSFSTPPGVGAICALSGSWTIQESTSPSGPWTTIFGPTNPNLDPDIKVRFGIGTNFTINNCRYIRISMVLISSCATATYSVVIYACPGGEPGDLSENSNNGVKEIFSSVTGELLFYNEQVTKDVPFIYDMPSEDSLFTQINTLLGTEFTISPNPAQDLVYISSDSESETLFSFFNTLGMQLFSGSFVRSTTFETQNLPSGIYYVNFKTVEGNSLGSKKLIIQKKE